MPSTTPTDALSTEILELKEKLKSELLKPEIDQAKVQALSAEIEATIGQATRTGVDTMGKVAGELSLEQRQKIAHRLERFMH